MTVVEELEWAQMTIKDKLKFGLPEDLAIQQREKRVRGVFMTVIPRVKQLELENKKMKELLDKSRAKSNYSTARWNEEKRDISEPEAE